MTLDPYSRQAQTGDLAAVSSVVTLSHAKTPLGLMPKIHAHFKGTKMVLVPSGTKGLLRLQDPYGKQVPNYRVIRTNKPLAYWFQQIQWVRKEL